MITAIILGSPWLSEGVRIAFGGGARCIWRGFALHLDGVHVAFRGGACVAFGGGSSCNWRGSTMQLEGVHPAIGGGALFRHLYLEIM